jgi:hypothetical protein
MKKLAFSRYEMLVKTEVIQVVFDWFIESNIDTIQETINKMKYIHPSICCKTLLLNADRGIRTALIFVGCFRKVDLKSELPPTLLMRSLAFLSVRGVRPASLTSFKAFGRTKAINTVLSFATTVGLIHVLS